MAADAPIADRLLAGEDPRDPEACLDAARPDALERPAEAVEESPLADPWTLCADDLRQAAGHWRGMARHYRLLGEYSDYPPTYREELARSQCCLDLASALDTAANLMEILP